MSNNKQEEDYPLVLSVQEIAEILSVGKKNAYDLVRSEPFVVIRIGKQFRVSRKVFFNWLHGKEDIA